MPLRRARVPGDATAVILAGGLGTRLRDSLPGLPKVLAPVAGAPFLGRLLEHLSANAVHDVVLCTGYRAGDVEAFAGDGSRWGLALRYSVEDEPLGTAGALRKARDLVRSTPFLAMNGDSFLKTSLAPFFEEHIRTRARATLLLVRVADASRYGSVQISEDRRVLSFEEKGSSAGGLINAGIYALDISVLDGISAPGPISFERDVLPALIGNGLFGYAVDAPFIDIGTPESLAEAGRFFS